MGGGGGIHPRPQQVFQVFLRMGRAFIANKIFSCNLILGTSVHQKTCQIGSTILALKLDERGGCLVSYLQLEIEFAMDDTHT